MIQLKQFKFEKLQAWEIAMDYAEKIQFISGNFPSKELYNLQSQINRASDSIALNISEGATGNSNLEFRRFYIPYAQLPKSFVVFLKQKDGAI